MPAFFLLPLVAAFFFFDDALLLEELFFFEALFFLDEPFFFLEPLFFFEAVFFFEATFFFGFTALGSSPILNLCAVSPSFSTPDCSPFWIAVLKYELNSDPLSFSKLISIQRAMAALDAPFLVLRAWIAFTVISKYVNLSSVDAVADDIFFDEMQLNSFRKRDDAQSSESENC